MTEKLTQLIRTRIRQDVQSMHAYAVQDSAGMVKLDAMETRTACLRRCKRIWVNASVRWRLTVTLMAG